MSYILDKYLKEPIGSSRIIVCEGMGDASFINKLLEHYGIDSFRVGCPSTDSVGKQGKSGIGDFLKMIAANAILNKTEIDTLLLIGDADESQSKCFQELCQSLVTGGFPCPNQPFMIEYLKNAGKKIRVGIFVIPGSNAATGTLEHLLLEAVAGALPERIKCVDQFVECTNALVNCTENKRAKMKMSALASTCKDNPWTTLAYIWSCGDNPIPIGSAAFSELAEFIKKA